MLHTFIQPLLNKNRPEKLLIDQRVGWSFGPWKIGNASFESSKNIWITI